MKWVSEAPEFLLRDNNISVVNRKASVSSIRTANTLFGVETYVATRDCRCCGKTQPINNFYVKSGRQHISPENLTENDYRTICIPCHDEESKVNSKNRRHETNQKIDKLVREFMGLSDDQLHRLASKLDGEIAYREMDSKPSFLDDIING